MPTLQEIQEYAQLSTRVYPRTDENSIPVPAGWTELQRTGNASLSGFAAGVYQNGNDIVIAYTGTNEKQAVDFLLANIPAGLSIPSAQVTEAMLLYFQVKQQHPTANITFTGHSLGGGLASLMAVFFDRPATIFDPAPFETTARNLSTLGFYQIEMTRRGLSDAAFNAYTQDATGDLFSQREAKVTGYSLESEILGDLRAVWPTVEGTHTVIPVGEQTLLGQGGRAYRVQKSTCIR